LTIFTIVFNLAFAGKNFFQGVVSDKNVQTGKNARIIFFPGDKKRGWLALLSTDTALDSEEIVRLYGKRWDIEVFFKMCKQHLKLVKEIQIRDFDGLTGHTSMVLAQYNILSWFQRHQVDHRSFGELFRTCLKSLKISYLSTPES
jgi:hypothetical protein